MGDMKAFKSFEAAGTGGNFSMAGAEIELAKQISELLFSHYAGYMWHVEADMTNRPYGVKIALPVLMPVGKHYVIPIRLLVTHEDTIKYTVRAGGEILERYKIPRTGIKMGLDQFLTARVIAKPNLRANGR